MALARLYCFPLLITASAFCAKLSNVGLSILVSMSLAYASNLEKFSAYSVLKLWVSLKT